MPRGTGISRYEVSSSQTSGARWEQQQPCRAERGGRRQQTED